MFNKNSTEKYDTLKNYAKKNCQVAIAVSEVIEACWLWHGIYRQSRWEGKV